MNSFIENRVAVAAITHRDVRIWAVNDPAGTAPERVFSAPDDQRQNHYRQVQRNDRGDTDKFDRDYFESVAVVLAPAKEILLIGHGTGKANEMLKLVQFLERYHPATAKKVVGAEDAPLEALTDAEVMAFARKWFAEPLHAR